MSTISRICPRTLGRAQSLCRGFSNRNIPVHRHSARDHQRVDLVPWNDFFSPSSILPASFSSRFRDIEKMMRDMENVLEHKYLSFPARGEDSEVCEWTTPPPPLAEFTSGPTSLLNCLSLYDIGAKNVNMHIYACVMK